MYEESCEACIAGGAAWVCVCVAIVAIELMWLRLDSSDLAIGHRGVSIKVFVANVLMEYEALG